MIGVWFHINNSNDDEKRCKLSGKGFSKDNEWHIFYIWMNVYVQTPGFLYVLSPPFDHNNDVGFMLPGSLHKSVEQHFTIFFFPMVSGSFEFPRQNIRWSNISLKLPLKHLLECVLCKLRGFIFDCAYFYEWFDILLCNWR